MPSDLAIHVDKLSVFFDDFCAVREISFDVKQGEIFGFLGANGAGKTTTIRVLCGLLPPSSGTVTVAGIPYESGEMAIKQRVGYMSQKFTLYDDLTVEENLNFTASLRKIPRKVYLERRSKILDFISFKRSLKSFVKDLPGGTKQQVALAASMLHDPEIVFLDEPTAGVTPAARARFWALLRELAGQKKTIFVSTHYMDEAEQCERIALMGAGQIIALDSPLALKGRAFPQGVYEMNPRSANVGFARIQELRKHSGFSYFEPYGLRFHAEFKGEHETKLARELEKDFEVRKIQPTLEDVFIRFVEGSKR